MSLKRGTSPVFTIKTTCFGECFTCFGCETTGMVRNLVIFQDRPTGRQKVKQDKTLKFINLQHRKNLSKALAVFGHHNFLDIILNCPKYELQFPGKSLLVARAVLIHTEKRLAVSTCHDLLVQWSVYK